MGDIKLLTETEGLKAMNLSLPANNELVVDDLGNPSVMVKIPKLTYADVGIGSSSIALPAFIVNGKEIPYIYISKYQNIVENDRAYSLPYKVPCNFVTFEEARTFCENKGAGWHLMTNAEWAAIALWCKKNDCQPYGNNNSAYGDYYNTTDKGAPMPVKQGYDEIPRTATGSGPKNWYHNNDFSGIADLNGNVYEWVGGLRLYNGEIQVIPNNDASQAVDQSVTSTLWKAIDQTGAMVAPGTANTLKFHNTTGINTNGTFKGMTAASGIAIPNYLKALALYPNDAENTYRNDAFSVSTSGETVPHRGGSSYGSVNAGVFSCNLNCHRTAHRSQNAGFRSAYVPQELL